MREYWELFVTFARIGGLTFGGGYAMLPMLQREVVENKKWATDLELTNYYAIGQCTPGVIAVNVATWIGNRLKGTRGAIVATLGVVFPSFVIILLIATVLSHFSDSPAVSHAFAGIRVGVCVLVFNAVVKLWKTAVKGKFALFMFAAVFCASVFLDVSAAVLVLSAGVVGLLASRLRGENQ